MDKLEIVKNNGLFSDDECRQLTNLQDELNHAMVCRQIFRTETEMRISVLNDIHFPTKASKYWQSIREQTAMFDELVKLSFVFRRNELAIKRLTADLAISKSFDAEEIQINLDECMYVRTNLLATANDRRREILLWSKIKLELDDGSFDTNDVNAHQLVSYTRQFMLRSIGANIEKMTEAEVSNLTGQLQTSLERCKEMGVLDSALKDMPMSSIIKLLPGIDNLLKK